MELLDYLIRTLTYKRSCWELDLKKLQEQEKYEYSFVIRIQAKIDGLNTAITEIYKLVGELSLQEQERLIKINDQPKKFTNEKKS